MQRDSVQRNRIIDLVEDDLHNKFFLGGDILPTEDIEGGLVRDGYVKLELKKSDEAWSRPRSILDNNSVSGSISSSDVDERGNSPSPSPRRSDSRSRRDDSKRRRSEERDREYQRDRDAKRHRSHSGDPSDYHAEAKDLSGEGGAPSESGAEVSPAELELRAKLLRAMLDKSLAQAKSAQKS